jgi:hypothetical protein
LPKNWVLTPATLIGEGLLPGWVPFEQFDEMVSDALKKVELRAASPDYPGEDNEKITVNFAAGDVRAGCR